MLDIATQIDRIMSPRPPTGTQLNPLVAMGVRFDRKGAPLKRTIMGSPKIFQDHIDLIREQDEAKERSALKIKVKKGSKGSKMSRY